MRKTMIRGLRCNMASNQYVAALFIMGLLLLMINQAVAQPLGAACMFNAPSGATTGLHLNDTSFGHNPPAGHVGWAILDPVAGIWYFGATENSGGSSSVPAGGDDQTWMASGTWDDMITAFSSTAYYHYTGYYTRWRCVDSVGGYDVKAALDAQAHWAASGFAPFTDNCLTKSTAILNAYGFLNLGKFLLWGGWISPPNWYFDGLTNAGWGAVNYFAYPPGMGCMFNAPSGATVADGAGQVGWGFLDTGTGMWTFGATENNQCNCSTAFGGDNQSWMASGTQDDMYAAFKNAGYNHPSNYYLYYACSSVKLAAVGAALNLQKIGAGSGYDSWIDSCLTKTVAVLSAYGEESLSYPGSFENPNDYFDGLTGVGWGLLQVIP